MPALRRRSVLFRTARPIGVWFLPSRAASLRREGGRFCIQVFSCWVFRNGERPCTTLNEMVSPQYPNTRIPEYLSDPKETPRSTANLSPNATPGAGGDCPMNDPQTDKDIAELK